ncbi:unnamed protein product [Meloidogyne enterolobii]|uniref:Uncharacterized protein n=2 Tax=Meloidogyne enterolobii TaxID=390850 RepID=A0ACB0YH96_MELEN
MEALKTCLDATTCEECQKMVLKTIKCNWCIPKDGEDIDGTNNKPFCTDQRGLHRRRQEWLEENCQVEVFSQYCKAEEVTTPDNSAKEATSVDSQD